jgi:hypothetical protein
MRRQNEEAKAGAFEAIWKRQKLELSLTWPENLLRSSSYGASAKRGKVAP